MTSELRRLQTSFVDDNPLLYASLGLLSSFRALDRVLEEHAPERLAPAAPTSEDVLNDRGIELVLGLIALRMRIESRLHEAAGPHGAGEVAVPRPDEREGRLASLFR